MSHSTCSIFIKGGFPPLKIRKGTHFLLLIMCKKGLFMTAPSHKIQVVSNPNAVFLKLFE